MNIQPALTNIAKQSLIQNLLGANVQQALAASAKQALLQHLSNAPPPPPIECPATVATIASVKYGDYHDLSKLSALLRFENATIDLKFNVDPTLDLSQAANLEKAYQPPYEFNETITIDDNASILRSIQYDPDTDGFSPAIDDPDHYDKAGVKYGNRNIPTEIKQSIDHLVCRIGGQAKSHLHHTKKTQTNNLLRSALEKQAKDALLAQIGITHRLREALAESAKAALLKELRPETGLRRHLEKLAKDQLLDHLRRPNKMAVLNRLSQAAKDVLVSMLQNRTQNRAQSILKRALVRHMVRKARERRSRMEELKQRLAELAKERLQYALRHPKETQLQQALEQAAQNALRTAIWEKAQEIQNSPLAKTLRERAQEELRTKLMEANRRNQANQAAVEKALGEAATKALRYYLSDEYKLKTLLEEKAKRHLADTLYASKLLVEWKDLISRFVFDGGVLKRNADEITSVLGDKARVALLAELLEEKERRDQAAEDERINAEAERQEQERIDEENRSMNMEDKSVLLIRNQHQVRAAVENAARNALVKELEASILAWKDQNKGRVHDALLAASKTALMEKLQEIRKKAADFLASWKTLIGQFEYDGTKEREKIAENAKQIKDILEGKSTEALIGRLNETMKHSQQIKDILKDKSTEVLIKLLNETIQEEKRKAEETIKMTNEEKRRTEEEKRMAEEETRRTEEEKRRTEEEKRMAEEAAEEERKRALETALETQLLDAIQGSALTKLRELIQANSPQQVAEKKLDEMKTWIQKFTK